MDKQHKTQFENILGIRAPWFIQEITVDVNDRVLEIELASQIDKPRFLFGKSKNAYSGPLALGRWQHTNIGNYQCFISAEVPVADSAKALSRAALSQPAFIGEAGKKYTHQLRQQVALSSVRGFDRDTINHVFNLDGKMVDIILADINTMPAADRVLAHLPTEVDSVWQKILLDKQLIKTQMLPLRLLLSKLKLASITGENIEKLNSSIYELRQFFIAHGASLESEYSQVCGLSMKKAAVAERKKAASRLVLPALKSSIWIHLLTGRINLKSNNMSLNLLLVRQKSAFQNSDEKEVKIRAISSLREFFKKNARSLKQELIAINRLMQQQQKSPNKVMLPDPQHNIWQKILKDDSFIPSNHMAYKLLLAKLRSNLLMYPDAGLEVNAAKRVREFYAQNQKSMQQELRMVLNQSTAI